jgi:long-chain acyl-CoA synthetase
MPNGKNNGMLKERFVDYIENSLQKNMDITALSDYKGESFTYSETSEQILKFHILFEEAGMKRGDKIALLGKNSARWCMVYLAVVTYGGVIVPILPDFKPDDVQYIINHSDAVLLFIADSNYLDLDILKMPLLKAVISLNTFHELHTTVNSFKKSLATVHSLFDKKFPNGISSGTFHLPEVSNNELAVISYTSGTTGFSKGVMLTHNSLAANIRFAQNNMPLKPGDAIVSFLPLAHTYGCAFEFLFPFSIGCHVTILTKTPSPQIVVQAFQEIKPALILSVPLVIEKIYRKQLLPAISKSSIKFLLAIPGINKLLYKKIKAKLLHIFGGNFHEIVIGGAPFNHEAEVFFRKINFPYTVGYGMTECGPLISYISSEKIKLGSSGKAVDTLEVRIDSPDPQTTVGEIILKGENVMLGYYKNEEATQQIIDADGWLHTGDLGIIDKDGNIFIKGRSKSLILGANGKNIYPEELEAQLDNKYAVGESLIVHRGDKLVALIYPDMDMVAKHKISEKELEKIYKHHLKEVNNSVPAYMNISKFVVHNEEFVKTPKRSIKRYLYA